MEKRHLDELNQVLAKVLGDWWQDDRRWWCAYCGIPMRRKAGTTQANSLATHDHIIPKAVHGGTLSIPACRECNVAKGATSMPEFLQSPYFKSKRLSKHKQQWPVWQLWFASGLASFKTAAEVVDTKAPAKPALQKSQPAKSVPKSKRPVAPGNVSKSAKLEPLSALNQ